jgi:hypothetical protein
MWLTRCDRWEWNCIDRPRDEAYSFAHGKLWPQKVVEWVIQVAFGSSSNASSKLQIPILNLIAVSSYYCSCSPVHVYIHVFVSVVVLLLHCYIPTSTSSSYLRSEFWARYIAYSDMAFVQNALPVDTARQYLQATTIGILGGARTGMDKMTPAVRLSH